MTAAPAIDDPDEVLLAEMAQRDAAVMRRAHELCMAAPDEDFAAKARSYQRATRSLRQTLLLKARMKEIRAQGGRRAAQAAIEVRRAESQAVAAALEAPPPASGAELARRTGETRTALTRLIWRESETERERLDRLRTLTDKIRMIAMSPRFAAMPAEDHIVRLALELKLDPQAALRWRELPRAPRESGDAPPPAPAAARPPVAADSG